VVVQEETALLTWRRRLKSTLILTALLTVTILAKTAEMASRRPKLYQQAWMEDIRTFYGQNCQFIAISRDD
jgi:hypothetical protein